MSIPVVIHRPGADLERTTLAAPLVAGGSRADGLFLPGAPPAALRLLPRPAGLVLEATAAGVRASGQALAPGARRLVRPGERVEIRGFAIEVERGRPEEGATRVAAADLLREVAAGADPVRGAHLVVLTGPAAGDRHALGDGWTIGRGRSARIRIPDPRASRIHARLGLAPGGTTVEDLRSKNGLRVNGVRVERRPFPLRHGDEIAVGDTTLALEHPGATPRESRPASPAHRRRVLRASWTAAALLALSAAALALAAS